MQKKLRKPKKTAVTKHGTKTKKTSTHRKNTATLLRRPQTTIGLLLIIAGILTWSWQTVPRILDSSLTLKPSATPISELQSPQIILDSKVTEPTAASTSAQVATAAAETTATPAPQPTRVVVKKDQTFWEFAKRYCGSHTYAESMARNNGYRRVTDLKQGDTITVVCK